MAGSAAFPTAWYSSGWANTWPATAKDKAFCQRQIALRGHHPAPLQNLVTDVDFHRAHFRAGAAQTRVEWQFAVLELVEGWIENDADGTRIRGTVSQPAAPTIHRAGVHASATPDAFERMPEIGHSQVCGCDRCQRARYVTRRPLLGPVKWEEYCVSGAPSALRASSRRKTPMSSTRGIIFSMPMLAM